MRRHRTHHLRSACLALCTVLCLQLYADSRTFQSPVDYPVVLAGNFGEPRPHHFHGGLDVKTDGVEGKHLYAIADGYVSRITVGLYGFGNAVYITHPTGHTSVYCHLKSFSPRIKAALRRYQYANKTSVADARLTPLDVPVAKGQFIALSGNTGHSTAPHLHLELHDTRTWDMIDPYPFLSEFISDTVPPQAHAFMAIPQTRYTAGMAVAEGTFNGSSQKQNFGFSSHNLTREFTAWGRVGFALWGNDYMQDSYNHYGIRKTTLLVDGREVFSSETDNIPVSFNRMVNFWGDYDHYRHNHVWYMKSFSEPACLLPMLLTDSQRGIVNFCEERLYHLVYILNDYKGNEARYSFTVRGERPSAVKSPVRIAGPVLRCNRTSTFTIPGLQLVVPYGLIAADVVLTPTVKARPDGYADAYAFAAASIPLAADAELSIFARRPQPSSLVSTPTALDTAKFYITDENKRFHGGEYRDGWVTGRIRELSSIYTIAYDDRPPTVKLLSANAGRIVFSITDGDSGLASWTATVDGRFVVFDAIEKSSSFVCNLGETWLRPTGKTHRLRLTATDNRDNSETYETTFTY